MRARECVSGGSKMKLEIEIEIQEKEGRFFVTFTVEGKSVTMEIFARNLDDAEEKILHYVPQIIQEYESRN